MNPPALKSKSGEINQWLLPEEYRLILAAVSPGVLSQSSLVHELVVPDGPSANVPEASDQSSPGKKEGPASPFTTLKAFR